MKQALWLTCVVVVLLLGFALGYALGSDVYRTRVSIVQHDTWDAHGVQFYQISFGDGVRATLSIDGDAPFAEQLRQRLNQPLILSLEPAELTR